MSLFPIMDQGFTSDDYGEVVFRDRYQNWPSVMAQPRDIEIVNTIEPLGVRELDKLRTEIAVDIRRGQGYDEIGLQRNLKY